MGVLDRFERGVERAVNGSFAKVFRGELKPVDLTAAVRKEADLRAIAVDRGRTIAPNVYLVHLAEEDYATVQAWGEQMMADELAQAVVNHAADQGYAFVGPVTVTLEATPGQSRGTIEVTSTAERSALSPAAAQDPISLRHPLLEIDGQRYLLTEPVTVVGRGSEADITVDDPGVSRRHLEISITPTGVVARDLGSTNGLYVEGHKVPAATLVDGNTLTIGRTRIQYWAPDALLGAEASHG